MRVGIGYCGGTPRDKRDSLFSVVAVLLLLCGLLALSAASEEGIKAEKEVR